jgi:hypothetical protein
VKISAAIFFNRNYGDFYDDDEVRARNPHENPINSFFTSHERAFLILGLSSVSASPLSLHRITDLHVEHTCFCTFSAVIFSISSCALILSAALNVYKRECPAIGFHLSHSDHEGRFLGSKNIFRKANSAVWRRRLGGNMANEDGKEMKICWRRKFGAQSLKMSAMDRRKSKSVEIQSWEVEFEFRLPIWNSSSYWF